MVPLDINYMLATSTGLPYSINIIASGVSVAHLDGNIAVQIFCHLSQKYTHNHTKKQCFQRVHCNNTTSDR